MNELLELSKNKFINARLAMPPKSKDTFLISGMITIDIPDELIIDTEFNHDHKIYMKVSFYILQHGMSYINEDCNYSLDNALDTVINETCSTACHTIHTDPKKIVLYFRENKASFFYSFKHILAWIKINDLNND